MRNTTSRGPRGWFLLFSLAAFALMARPAHAADVEKTASSLKLVPANAELYSVMLRNAEQFKAISQSKAWKKLMELDGVQDLLKEAKKQFDDPRNPLGRFLKEKENQDLLDLLGDMVGQEIFFYAPSGFSDFISLFQVYQEAQFSQMFAILSGHPPKPEDQIHALLSGLKERKDKLKIPGFVWGFRVEDVKRAKTQLGRLEKLLGNLVEKTPELKGRFKMTKIGDNSYLTLTFDGKMIPWDAIPWDKVEKKPGEFDDLVKKLKEMKLTIALGVREGPDNYVLLSIGESTAPVTALGRGESLATRDEFKPLAKHAEKKVTSIGYVSKAFNTSLGASKEDIDATVQSWMSMLDDLDLTKDQKQKIRKDLALLAKDVKDRLPEPGASLTFSFLTDRGSESYEYDWSRQPGTPVPKALSLLNHVGGNPLIAVVGRSGSSSDYKLLAKWVRVADGYLDEFLLPKLDCNTKQQAEAVLKVVRPAFRKFDDVTTKILLPSLDGQFAFVLDAKMTSEQWVERLPNSARPLPLPEPAFVYGLSDSAKFEKALGEYRTWTNDLIKDIAGALGQNIDFEIPAAKTRQLKGGTLYYYPLPAVLGVDKRIAPNAGIGEKAAVFCLAPETTQRLLTSTPLKAGGVLAKTDRPMLSASYVNVAGLLKAIEPWVSYGLEAAFAQGGPPKDQQERILKHVRAGFEILSIFRGVTSYTTVEGKATVTHSEMHIRDLDE